MARVERIRTTAFRMSPEHFGRVFVYRPGPSFGRVWGQLEEQWRRKGDTEQRRPPYRGLATALRVLSGDFVALQRRVAGDPAFIISRRKIGDDELAMAVGAWEAHALRMPEEPVTRVLDDLSCEEVDVASHVHRRPGLCPTITEGANWVWDVAIWEIAHRLAGAPLQTDDGPAILRLDSDAALLTWDRLIAPDGTDRAAAMHKIVLHLMTVPGVEEPIVSLQSSLVRLAPSWRETGGARYAWADIGSDVPILRGRVRTRRDDNGFTTFWDDRAAEVLRGASFEPLPNTEREPTLDGSLRTGYARQPRSHRIGRGVGAWFHECVAHHAQQALGPTARCLELETSRASWPTRKQVAPRLPLSFEREDHDRRLRLVVIYANSGVRKRVRDALAHVLSDDAHPGDLSDVRAFASALNDLPDGTPLSRGPVEVQFLRPPDAEKWLLNRNAEPAIEEWLSTWLPVEDQHVRAAIIETDESAARGRDKLADPKVVLRGSLARQGVVSQFITQGSAPSSAMRRRKNQSDAFTDHGASNAIGDLLRSAGFFLRPFPEFGAGEDTIVVGIYGTRFTRWTTGRRTSYLANLVAVSLGTQRAWGYIDERGWTPIDQATAWFLGTDHSLSEAQARQRVERAIGQLPLALGDRPTILLFDAAGCRRYWPCLTDKSDAEVDAWMRQNNTAVVRVRTTTSEVPRPAGAGVWDDGLQPARHTDFRPMSIMQPQGRAPTFVLSGSAVMSQGQSARKSTRFAASVRGLREDWHSLGTTELLVLEPGAWEPSELIAQVAMLCRIAPTWNRTLRWPSPLHLARAVVRDHPHGYFSDGEDAEEAEDTRQMRFDFGIF